MGAAARERSRRRWTKAARASMAEHVRAMLAFQRTWACRRSITATTSARWPRRKASTDAFDFPGFVPAYIRPLFCRGVGPFRWAALSGDPEDIYRTDAKVKELLPDDAHLHQLAGHGARAHRIPGPAGAHLLGRAGRPPPAGPRVQRDGRAAASLRRPIVIGRDHLDSGSVASPNRETEAMRGRLGCRLRLAAAERAAQLRLRRHLGVAAPWRRRGHGVLAACRHGDRVPTARKAAARRLARVLWNDPATGVMRHADAGYDIALNCARENGLDLPSLQQG